MHEIRLLFADADEDVKNVFKTHAAPEGFIIDEAADGIAAIKLFRRNDYHVIILDAALRELRTWHVCRQVRKSSDTPIIIISRQSGEREKLSFFDAGIDDFMIKPFSQKELIARIRVMLRHSTYRYQYTPRRIMYDGLCIDVASRTVYVDSEPILLTPKEYNLLLFLAKNPDKAMSRQMLLNEVWGRDFFGTDRTVDSHIKMVRERIKPYNKYIQTVWGIGYIFRT